MLSVYSNRLKIILGSPTPRAFLSGAIALGLITNGLSTTIATIVDGQPIFGGIAATIFGSLFLIVVVVLFDLPNDIKRFFKHPEIQFIDSIERRQGLVALVSPGENGSPHTRDAIIYHLGNGSHLSRLKFCWLIVGPGNGKNSSEENANSLKKEFEEQGIKVEIKKLESSENPEEVYNIVLKIYEEANSAYNLKPDQIVSDFTAATKSMTSGMTLACASRGWSLQYMRVDRDSDKDDRGRVKDGVIGTPILVNFDFFHKNEKVISV